MWISDIHQTLQRAAIQQLEAGGGHGYGAAAVAEGGAGGGAGHRPQHSHVPPHPRHARHCQGEVQVWKHSAISTTFTFEPPEMD